MSILGFLHQSIPFGLLPAFVSQRVKKKNEKKKLKLENERCLSTTFYFKFQLIHIIYISFPSYLLPFVVFNTSSSLLSFSFFLLFVCMFSSYFFFWSCRIPTCFHIEVFLLHVKYFACKFVIRFFPLFLFFVVVFN